VYHSSFQHDKCQFGDMHTYFLDLVPLEGILPFFLGPENHYFGGKYILSVGELSSYHPITVHEPIFMAIFLLVYLSSWEWD
jgi:hypothetical protein